MDERSKIKDHESRIMDHGSKILDQGSRILDLGPCSGMNNHPGRDTDVRSRPSESNIKDLSFYIGFIRIQSSIKHLGPCFGMNAHFSRDPDVIPILSDTTTQDLSVFIGFRCSSSVKIIVLDENIGYIKIVLDFFYRIFMLFRGSF